MKIDLLQAQDLLGLKNLYEKGFETKPIDIPNMQETFEKIKNDVNCIILIAKIDGEVVGSVQGNLCYELFGTCKPFMVVENVVVLPENRRHGVARELMIQLEEYAKQSKCSAILFVSSAHRAGAHKLYESLGFGEDKVNGYRKRLQ